MKRYTENLQWAVVSIIDRHTQDDHRSKLQLAGLFPSPIVAEDFFLPNLPNKEIKRYLLHVDDLERFEEFYNHVQEINEKYGDLAIFHIKERFSVDELNRFRSILGLWSSTEL